MKKYILEGVLQTFPTRSHYGRIYPEGDYEKILDDYMESIRIKSDKEIQEKIIYLLNDE